MLNKEKEKSTVLFMEVVRLGDTVDKMNDYVNSVTKSHESKYQELENKMSNSDKNMMIVSQRTSSGSDVMNELGDKIMSRLNTSESNLLMLGVSNMLYRKNKSKIKKPSLGLWPRMIELAKTFSFSSEICRLTSKAN